MSDPFFDDPILNSPYERPIRHWELDSEGIPTRKIIEKRRDSQLITPIPKPNKRGNKDEDIIEQSILPMGYHLSEVSNNQNQVTQLINSVRSEVNKWRCLPENQWKVTSETARLLKYWRYHEFSEKRPFLSNRGT